MFFCDIKDERVARAKTCADSNDGVKIVLYEEKQTFDFDFT